MACCYCPEHLALRLSWLGRILEEFIVYLLIVDKYLLKVHLLLLPLELELFDQVWYLCNFLFWLSLDLQNVENWQILYSLEASLPPLSELNYKSVIIVRCPIHIMLDVLEFLLNVTFFFRWSQVHVSEKGWILTKFFPVDFFSLLCHSTLLIFVLLIDNPFYHLLVERYQIFHRQQNM